MSRCRDKFRLLFPAPPLAQLQDQGFYSTMSRLLADPRPRPLYTNSDWATRAFFWIIGPLIISTNNDDII